jgi:hypothetical protein
MKDTNRLEDERWNKARFDVERGRDSNEKEGKSNKSACKVLKGCI